MSDAKKLWIVKDPSGKTYGPYEIEKVLYLVENLVFTGVEKISEYPGGDFVSISQVNEIYDKFLEVWESEAKELGIEERSRILSSIEPTNAESERSQTGRNEDTTGDSISKSRKKKPKDGESVSFVEGSSPDLGDFETNGQSISMRKERVVKQSGFQKDGEESSLSWKAKREKTYTGTQDDAGRIQYEREISFKNLAKENQKILARIAGILLAGAVALFLYETPPGKKLSEEQKISLILPKMKVSAQGQKNASERGKTLIRITQMMEKDDFSSYLKAQSLLVDYIEKKGADVEALGLLCSLYKELWPYAKRDSRDLSTISKVNQVVSRLSVAGKANANCRSIQFMFSENYVSAEQVVDKALLDFPGVAAFYDLKGDISMAKERSDVAIPYYQKVRQLWPQWLRPYFQIALLWKQKGMWSEAHKALLDIVEKNPQHRLAAIELAELELERFGNLDFAMDLLNTVVEDAEHLPRRWRAKSYFVLSLSYKKKGDKDKTISYAKRAYELDTSNSAIKVHLEEMAGNAAFLEIYRTEQELLDNGDLFFRKSNYLAAQAEYKAAFEINPQNEIAGIKAAQSLWQLNQSDEAVRWLEKTLEANPKSIEAILLLANYQTENYDFEKASKNLKRAKSVSKEDYRVSRAYARFELARNNFKAAKEFSEHAIKLYDTDMESHYVLTKAMLGLNAYDQAYKTIARAVGLEPTNTESQALYAEVLSLFQGVDAGVRYITNLINTYPSELEYRESLARIFLRDNQWERAIQVLKQVTLVRGDYKPGFLLLASSYVGANRSQEALEAYLAAASLDPTDAHPFVEIGKLYLLSNKPRLAQEQFERAKSLNPNYPRVYYYYGKSLLEAGNAKEALKNAMLERARNPLLADSYLLAADSYLQMRQYNSAITEYQGAVQRRPQSAEIYVRLAICYRLIGSLEVAEQMLNTAEAKESAYPEIYKEAGAIFEKRGKRLEAKESYEKYLSLKPGAKDAAMIRGKIQSLGD